MIDQVLALRVFVRVARTGSFSRAAKEAKLSQPTASRMVTALETQLGVTLLSRSTRAVTLTDAGAEYLERIEPVLAGLDEADQAVRASGELRGTLRVGVTTIFASQILVPRLAALMDRHPALRIELVIDDRRQNLIVEGVDLAIRFGRLTDSTATSRRLGTWPIMLAASPSYVRDHGAPKAPADLGRHRVIGAGPVKGPWTLRSNGGKAEPVTVKIDARLGIDASEVGVNAAIAGLGIMAGSEVVLAAYIADGRLVRILPKWDLGPIDAHVLFANGRAPKAAARAFTDFLVDALLHTCATPPSTKSSMPFT